MSNEVVVKLVESRYFKSSEDDGDFGNLDPKSRARLTVSHQCTQGHRLLDEDQAADH